MVGKNNILFTVANYTFLILLGILCLIPLVNTLAVSLSSATAAGANEVGLWPVDFTLKSYKYVIAKPEFMHSFWVSLQRVVLGVTLSMALTILSAYPLSKDSSKFRFRTLAAWLYVFTMLFSGGLIPYFLVVKQLGLINSIWALVIPSAMSVFNVILLLNFFRGIPKELEESAFVDGANHWRILWQIYVPLSAPALATLILFTVVNHWNSWFDGLLFINDPNKYPLSTYLQNLLSAVSGSMANMDIDQVEMLKDVSNRTQNAAQIFIAAFPVLIVYPFLQRFFVKGLVLGSVKE